MSSLRNKLNDYCALFGPAGLFWALRSKLARTPRTFRIRTLFSDRPLWFRLKTSDVPVAVQIFVNGEYRFSSRQPVRTVVDAGANTGFSSLYLARQFPEARVIALEPESSNFELLLENTRDCPRIECEKMALWSEDTALDVVDWFGKCGFRTKPAEEEVSKPVCGTVSGISVPSLMDRCGMERIDFLKMDIEGAEKEVFSNASGWIDRVGVLAVELHDWLDPDCSAAFQNIADQFDVCWVQGENHFCARQEWAE